MTNRIALVLALAILGVFVADALWLDLGLPLRAARQLVALVEWLSFWR